jgi:hypothetical protein
LIQLDELSAEYIVFSKKLSEDDIQYFQEKRSDDLAMEASLFNPRLDEAEYVKMWAGFNQDIKIITSSYFDSLGSLAQSRYANHTTLITEGEYLTLLDINLFEISRK